MINKRTGWCLLMLGITRIKFGCMLMMNIENRMMMSPRCCMSRTIRIIRRIIEWIIARIGMLMMNTCRCSVPYWWGTIHHTIVKCWIIFHHIGCSMYIELCSKCWIAWWWKIEKWWISDCSISRTGRCSKRSTTNGWRWWGRSGWWTIFGILKRMRQIHREKICTKNELVNLMGYWFKNQVFLFLV